MNCIPDVMIIDMKGTLWRNDYSMKQLGFVRISVSSRRIQSEIFGQVTAYG